LPTPQVIKQHTSFAKAKLEAQVKLMLGKKTHKHLRYKTCTWVGFYISSKRSLILPALYFVLPLPQV